MKIRYLTPKEEEEDPKLLGHVTKSSPKLGTKDTLTLKKFVRPRRLGPIIAHEIGHIKYPWYHFPRLGTKVESEELWRARRGAELSVEWLLNELTASYYALTLTPKDKFLMAQIRLDKRDAKAGGMSSDMVDRIDHVVRTRVGYKVREMDISEV